MKRLSFVLVALLSLVLGINAQENLTGDMYNLTKIRSGVRNHRVSRSEIIASAAMIVQATIATI